MDSKGFDGMHEPINAYAMMHYYVLNGMNIIKRTAQYVTLPGSAETKRQAPVQPGSASSA